MTRMVAEGTAEIAVVRVYDNLGRLIMFPSSSLSLRGRPRFLPVCVVVGRLGAWEGLDFLIGGAFGALAS